MLYMKRFTLFVMLSFLIAATASASYRLVLQAGHEGPPVALEWHELSETVVSAGEDGRIIVTDPKEGRVLHRFRVTRDRIVDVKVDPRDKRVAVVTTGKDGSEIAVWDWDEEEKVFGFDLESEPLFLSWSARGRYIVAGNLGTPSVLVLEGRTGRRLSYLQRLPSLYNAGYIGSTETILMTYASSGAIRYWDIRSAALKGSSETVSNLQGAKVLQIRDSDNKKTMMFGYRNESLYIINRNTGAIMDQLDIPGLINASVEEGTGEIDVLSNSPSGTALNRYVVRDGIFMPRNSETDNFSEFSVSFDSGLNPVEVLRGQGGSYVMNGDGKLYAESASGFAPVIEDRIWRPDSLAFTGESLYIAGGDSIRRFVSPFFAGDSKGNINDLEELGGDLSSSGTNSDVTGLETFPDGRLTAWAKDNGGKSGAGYRVFRYPEVESGRYIPTGSVLQELDIIDDNRLLTVDRSGTVAVVDAFTEEVFSTYSALGILDAVYSDDEDSILVGKSSGRSGSPLELIDAETLESIPVDDDRFMVYSLESGPRAIYSIGVESSGSGSSTVLLRHQIDKPEKTRIVFEEDGEDLDALLLPHPSGDGVFTTMGGRIRRFDNGSSIEYSWSEPVVALAARGEILYGIDVDGAMILWNMDGGEALLEIHFFNDGSWVALPPERDTIWASPGAVDNVILYRNGRPADLRRVSRVLEALTPVL